MRKLIAWLLLAAMVFLCSFWLFQCRTVKKDISRADSSSVRESQSLEQVWREITRELSARPEPKPAPDTVRYISSEKVVQVPTRYVYNYKETIREAGQKQEQAKEEKNVETAEKTVSRELPAWVPWAVVGVAVVIGIVVLIALLITLRRLTPK